MSNFRIKSKSRVNWSYDKFYMMISRSFINCKIELIENYPCNNAEVRMYVYNKGPASAVTSHTHTPGKLVS